MTRDSKLITGILNHVTMFHLATMGSITREVYHGDTAAAHRDVAGLIETRRLHRFWWERRTDARECFTARRRPFDAAEFHKRYALLRFATGHPQLRPLLPPTRLNELLAPVAAKAGVPTPDWEPCFLHRASNSQPQRLSLIRVGTGGDLQRVVEEIDQVVASPTFRPWLCFAMGGFFTLTYLLPAPQTAADELGRWLRRRPPLCRVGSQAIAISVFVYEARGIAA
jgi:hypothetical protein